MPPSDNAIFRSGNDRNIGDQTRSVAACTMLIGVSVIRQSIGASGEVMTSSDDDPMCRQTTTPSSLHACQKGFQWSVWKLGQPSFDGFSEKVTACDPMRAVRRTSSASTCGSQIAGNEQGMNRPGCVPHHSSMCQSLYARTIARATSLSSVRPNSCPQNCGNEGKHNDPRRPFASMSLTR